MTLDQIRKLCQEIRDKYDLQEESDYHEARKDAVVSVYLTLKFKADAGLPGGAWKPGKKVLDKL